MLLLSCKKPLLYLWALLASLALLSTPAIARDLYWNSQGQILASDIDGGNVEVLFDGSESSPPMEGNIVDVLSTDTHIYWTGHSGGDIWRANRDGSGAVQFIPDAGASIHFLEIDEARQKIYYSDYSAGLFEANLDDGSGIASFWSDTSPGAFAGLAMRGADLLWVSAGSNFLYESDPTFPDFADTTEMEGGDATYGLAYDPDTETAYFTNYSESTLRSYNFATQEHELLNTPGMTSPLDVALSPSGTHLLIAERGRGITGYQISNGGYELLVDDSDAYFGVAATADPGELEVPPPPEPPPPPPEDGEVMFVSDFEEETVEEAPRTVDDGGVWARFDTPEEGTATVVADVDDDFRAGTENKFLRVESARNHEFMTPDYSQPLEVVTLSFDFIGRFNEVDSNRWLNVHIQAGGARTHITSIRMENHTIRSDQDLSYGENDIPVRMETIMNNSPDTITYETPSGGTAELSSGMASLWLFHHTIGAWEQLHDEYVFAPNFDTRGPELTSIRFQMDSNEPLRSYDLDNVKVVSGAVLSDIEPDVPTSSSPYRLEAAWEIGPADRDYLTEGAEQRGLAFNPATGHLIVPDRGSGERPMTIAILDAATGDDVGTLSTTGISGGTFALNHVAASSDGAIYGANLSTDTINSPLKVYRWADESADPVVVYEGDPSEGDTGNDGRETRFGDTMALRGSGMNTQILMAPRFGVNPTILAPDGSMETFVATRLMTDIPPDDPAGLLTHGLAFGEGDTFFAKRQPQFGSENSIRPLVEVGFDVSAGTGQLLRTYDELVFPNDIGLLGTDLEKGLLVGVDSDAVNQDEEELRRPAKVMLFDLASLSDSTLNQALDTEEFGPSNWNGNGSGQVVFGDNDMVYVLDTSNGIGAFNIVEDSGETYASWQETHFPGETDPSIIGPDADPSGDGVPNLLKYALGLDPNAASRDGVPASGVQEFTVDDQTDEYLTLTFTKPDSVEDVGFSVKGSSDLVSWPDEAVLEESQSNGDGTTTFTYRDSAPLGSADRRFINLEVTILD